MSGSEIAGKKRKINCEIRSILEGTAPILSVNSSQCHMETLLQGRLRRRVIEFVAGRNVALSQFTDPVAY